MAKKSGKKRVITPEQQAKMQEGRRKAKVHKERVASAYAIEKQLKDAQRADDEMARTFKYQQKAIRRRRRQF